ncbi:hypothetical protein [Gracilibacillus dipsosauri]|uniref:hypothetical protein n=1 Tax=Gracilibacillus dipsosauri TaxID=178340 RepID=UPI00240A1ADD
MKVWAVTVFENGDMSTSVWGIYDSREKAETYKEELLNDKELNSDGYYLEVTISEHEVK